MPESNLKNQQELYWWETSERMDATETATWYGLTLGSFYVARSAGRIKLPKYPLGGKDYFKKSDCQKDIESRRVDPA